MTAIEKTLHKHLHSKLYDRNGTGDPKPIVKSVFIPKDKDGDPLLLLLCSYSDPDDAGKFEYCIFGDRLYGKRHVPSDSFGYGTKREALQDLKDTVFKSITGTWPWVIEEAWKEVKILWKGQDKI